jgi:DNA-directed RNA polymerase subunit M/transcription elongation factor TFIIS
MSLPKLESVKHELTIPSTDKKVTFRPFLVKEEKILLQAQESEDTKVIMRAMSDIIEACTFGAIDSQELTIYDLEYIFLQLRAKSVGENMTVNIKCENCDEILEIPVNANDIKVVAEKEIIDDIKLNDSINLKLRPYKIKYFNQINEDDLISSLIPVFDTIYDSENSWNCDDQSEKELREFIESMNHGNLEMIKEFIENQPKLTHTVKIKCKECGHTNEVVLEGLQSFFTSA